MTADRTSGWLATTRLPELLPGDVHVWCVRLDERSLLENRAVLSEEERVRAERFRFDADRRRFTVARASLRRLLAAYLACNPSEVELALGSSGKPRIASDARHALEFNVSHSAGVALLAFARGVEVGVDVEFGRTDVEMVELASRFFSGSEVQLVRNAPTGATAEVFYSIWTRKEACLKALGTGLGLELSSFSVVGDGGLSDSLEVTIPTGTGPRDVVVCGAPEIDRCKAALAWSGRTMLRPAWLMLADGTC